MLLAIDVGNTNTVLGAFEGKELKRTWRVSTHPLVTPDELRMKIHSLFELDGIHAPAIRAVIMSSVVPPMTAVLRQAFPNVDVRIIDHTWPFSFSIAAQPASGVGADRLVNAETVIREYGGPAIIIDSGTATTLCALSRDQRYLGGAIMAGIELSIEALARNTAKLFSVELVAPARAIGSNTAEALQSGLLFGYAAMLDGMVARFKAELGEPNARVVATGGVSAMLKGIAQSFTDVDPDLTLKGIAYLYEAIQKQ